MWDGYLSLGGNEVINVARTMAYVDAGYVPPGLNVQACGDCEALPDLLGDKPYASPLIDQAPWFESGNPDTWDFAGVIPLEITGAEGSTRTATVEELITDGGSVSGVRFGSRTIAVTALLIGKTTCSVEAGLSWLSQVLGGSKCSGPRPSGGSACAGDELCMLTCCPDEVGDSPVPGRMATTEVPVFNWSAVGGFYDGTTGEMRPNVSPAGTRQNLVPNPSFEVNLDSWTVTKDPDTTIEASADAWPSRWGAQSAKITQGATLTTVPRISVAVPVTGAFLNVAMQVGSRSATVRATVEVQFLTGSSAPVGGLVTTFVELNVNSYSRIVLSAPRPATATQAMITIRSTALGGSALVAGTVLYVDAVVAESADSARTPIYIDGDMNSVPGTTFSWLGTPNNSISQVVVDPQPVSLTGPVIECIDDATFTFGVTTTRGPVRVQAQALSPEGAVLYTGPWITVNGTTPAVTIDVDVDWGDWRPRLNLDPATPLPFAIDPSLTHVLYRSVEDCADQITRSFLDATTVGGPTVIERIQSECGQQIFRVEWTIVAGNPASLGPVERLATAVWAETAQSRPPIQDDFDLAFGVTAGRVAGTINDIDTLCNTTTQPAVLTVFDPCCPGFITPPALPSIADTCFDRPTTYERTWIQIPRDYAPEIEDGLLSVVLTNDGKTKRGLRIRVYPDPIGNGYQGIEECDFCDEFFITFIPANAVWTMNGDTRRVTTRPAGGTQDIVSSASVRGRAGGPFSFPVMQCNTGYVVVIDVPSQYVEDCGTDCKGDDQGSVWVDLTMRRSSL